MNIVYKYLNCVDCFIDPISITSLADYSLNNLTVGESVTVGCVVETCGSPNVVNFTRVDTSVVAVEESITRASDGAFNWNPTADISLVGTYRCIAQNELGNASRTFTISGIYLYLMDKSFYRLCITTI